MENRNSDLSNSTTDLDKPHGSSGGNLLIENKEPMLAGGLSLISAAMIFIGFFILPWFFCRLSDIITGQFTGFHILVQLIFGTIASLVGGLSEDSEHAGLAFFVLLFFATAFVADIPYSGYRVGKIGLKLVQTLDMPVDQQKKAAKKLKRAAVRGLIITFFYLSIAVVGVDFDSFWYEITITLAGKGLWVTLIGFGIAIAASTVISTTGSWKEQLRSTGEVDNSRVRPSPVPDQQSSVTIHKVDDQLVDEHNRSQPQPVSRNRIDQTETNSASNQTTDYPNDPDSGDPSHGTSASPNRPQFSRVPLAQEDQQIAVQERRE